MHKSLCKVPNGRRKKVSKFIFLKTRLKTRSAIYNLRLGLLKSLKYSNHRQLIKYLLFTIQRENKNRTGVKGSKVGHWTKVVDEINLTATTFDVEVWTNSFAR